jgi:DNA-binding CsgD family transcriptional regulator/tetratricopeptide (TPR) repeat protein
MLTPPHQPEEAASEEVASSASVDRAASEVRLRTVRRLGTGPRLVGRHRELAVLRAAYARSSAGDPSLVLVGGEAGSGKSRLVRELADEAHASGARVLRGACASTGGWSYLPVAQALGPVLRDPHPSEPSGASAARRHTLASLLPSAEEPVAEPEREDAAAGQQRLFTHVVELLHDLALHRPVVLVVEDVQWADASTRALLAHLAANLTAASVLLLVTYRTERLRRGDPLRSLLLELDRSAISQRFELTPLDDDEAASLLEGVLGIAPDPVATRDIIRRAQGNPLFCEELLAARRSGLEQLPPTIRDLLSERVDELDTAGRAVVDVGSVLGDRFDHRLLVEVASMDPGELLAGVRDALERDLLVVEPDGRGYAFRHGLLREAVHDALPPGDRLRWHTAAADVLERRPSLADAALARCAHHRDAAGDGDRALPAHVAAGAHAESVYGFAEAAHHLIRATELWEEVEPAITGSFDRVDLLRRAARATNADGDHEAARRLLTEALGCAADAEVAAVGQELGESLILAGDLEGGAERISSALGALPASAPPELRADLVATHGLTLALLGQGAAAVDRCEQALAFASDLAPSAAQARATTGLGVARSTLGDAEGALDLLGRARQLAERAPAPDEQLRACINLQTVLAWLGRAEDALQVGDEALLLAEALGRGRRHGAFLRCNRAELLFGLGRWPEALADLDALTAPQGTVAVWADVQRARLATAQGRFTSAAAALDRVARSTPSDAGSAICRAELALARHDPAAAVLALEHGRDAAPALEHAGLLAAQLRWLGVRANAELAELAAARRDSARVESYRASATRWWSETVLADGPWPRAYGALADAELCRGRGAHDAATWRTAVDRCTTLQHRYLAAYARWRYAEALLLSDAADQAGGPLTEAHAATVELGAEPLRRAVEALARRARVPLTDEVAVDERVPDPLDQLGLTGRERDVLRSLAAGCTNPEIGAQLHISRKTASVHVSNILRKLGVANRAEAVAAAHRLGVADEEPADAGT